MKKILLIPSLFLTFFSSCLCLHVFSQDNRPLSRETVVEEISNEQSSFAVRVDVDHTNRIYAKDELLHITVTSSEDGYLYLFYRDATGKVDVLFPNKYHQNNFVRKNTTVNVPEPGSSFRIRIDAPFGDELLKAVVSRKQLEGADLARWTRNASTSVDNGTMKRFAESLPSAKFSPPSETGSWAEHQIRIQTTDAAPNGAPKDARRFAVGVGISHFKDPDFSKLSICHIDAQKMMQLFNDRCGVAQENTILLQNDKATLDNVRKVLKEKLPQWTKPGDTVFIYWSGHGGQTEDKKNEFLIPYDGDGNNVAGTMLTDDMFGRWIQELDGRKIIVILDACNSGGQAAQAKSPKPLTLSKALDDDPTPRWQPLRFAFKQFATAKNIGQKDAAVIASSTASQVSFVRKESDLSVFTYFLLKTINEAGKPMTHAEWCEAVKPAVSDYVRTQFAGKEQTVVMQDDMTEPVVINPR